MSPYRLIRYLPLIAGLLLASVPALAQRPNFVLVVIDDAGFSDLGAYGGEIQTPNIDKIAKAGVRFAITTPPASEGDKSRNLAQHAASRGQALEPGAAGEIVAAGQHRRGGGHG